MGIPWPVAFGGTLGNLRRTLQKLLEPQQAGYIRPALLVDSFLLHRIHHCLPCTYGQSIAPLHHACVFGSPLSVYVLFVTMKYL
jgi:hypothetical protein